MDLSRVWHLVAVFCLTYVLIKIIRLHRRRQALLKALDSFAGPPSHWFYGHLLELSPISAVYRKVEKFSCLYPFAFPLWFGRFIACLNITHPDYAKPILARTEPKDNFSYRNIVPWIGKGLLVLHGPKWAQHRKLLTPGFHFSVLKPYVPLIADSTKVMLDKWEKLIVEEKSVELFEHVSLMTLDSLMKCAFGYNSNCQMYKENSYVQAVFELCFLIYARMHHIVGLSDLLYWFSSHGFRFRKACQVAHLHTEKVIKERKESLKAEEELQKIQAKRHLDFLDILLCAKYEDGTGLSDEDLRAEVDTFMFAGHDTTATGISWLLYIMAKHPEHQQKCREEVKEILGDREDIQWDDLGKMTYTTMCIKESLRVYPPVPVVSRKLSKPITFFDGRTLPEDIIVAVDIYSLHKNSSIWPDPLEFDPMRFSSENTSKRHSHAFIPFAAGSR
ncbi:PREDICTED: cytochrome P450 4B1 [Thamnophis sirtalis]|uniref:Cytochrome P450 4B1 n=1 Tax=Thamnophis sirtalis TaxID=35019 RepID=A0A6I9Z7F4_9SAUR|nr:PREDICTED: cytochrome P450 4B1 [Thamnophis sirtalis]